MIATKRYLPLEVERLLLYQSHKIYDQFQNQYLNELSDEIVGNCDTRMETTDVLTAQYFCGLIGVSTVETASIRKNFIEGDIGKYGQKPISMLQRNLLNVDEILRIPSTKSITNLRGNKPLLLNKIMYRESPISEYTPKWTKNVSTILMKEKTVEIPVKKEKLEWNNF